MAYPPIFYAVRALDVEALRREIAAGGDPDMLYSLSQTGLTPLWYAACYHTPYNEEQIRERLECISVLLEAGASVDKIVRGATPLHRCSGNESAAYQSVIAALLEAGADPNFTDVFPHTGPEWRRSVLAKAAENGTAATVRRLICAGAVDLDRALKSAIRYGKQCNCAPLLRAGAAIPAQNHPSWTAGSGRGDRVALADTLAYVDRIRAAGGYKKYEHAHRQRLVAIFAPKLPHLPVDMLGRVLEFVFDVGGH